MEDQPIPMTAPMIGNIGSALLDGPTIPTFDDVERLVDHALSAIGYYSQCLVAWDEGPNGKTDVTCLVKLPKVRDEDGTSTRPETHMISVLKREPAEAAIAIVQYILSHLTWSAVKNLRVYLPDAKQEITEVVEAAE